MANPIRPTVPDDAARGGIESEFRFEVRTALGLDMFASDLRIMDEIKRLKAKDERLFDLTTSKR